MNTYFKLKSNTIVLLIFLIAIVTSCQQEKPADATGTFVAEETIVSAEASGVLKEFVVETGHHLEKGEVVGHIDSTVLHLQKLSLRAKIEATLSKKPHAATQLAALHTQLKNAKINLNRIKNLIEDDAATQKQLDNAITRVKSINDQIKAKESSLNIQTVSLIKSTYPLKLQIKQIQERLKDHVIFNPVKGTVLTTYVEQYETVSTGMPLYKIADLSTMKLKAYVTGSQFADIKLGQEVTVKVDDGEGGYRKYTGIIIWISDEAEFTPKTIRTKDVRENLVYAIKVRVKNDGYLKIGMYGELEL